jgi:hypothetical protein
MWHVRAFLGFLAVEVPVRNDAQGFAYGDGHDADNSLHAEQEKVEVEVDPGQDVFVRHCHENRGTAVSEDGSDGVLGDGATAFLGGAHDGRGRSGAAGGGDVDSVVIVALLIVGHCVQRRVFRAMRGGFAIEVRHKVNGQPGRGQICGAAGSRAVGEDKDRTQERRAEKRSGAGCFTQGREWVGLNLLESPGVEGRVGLPAQFHQADGAKPLGISYSTYHQPQRRPCKS